MRKKKEICVECTITIQTINNTVRKRSASSPCLYWFGSELTENMTSHVETDILTNLIVFSIENINKNCMYNYIQGNI